MQTNNKLWEPLLFTNFIHANESTRLMRLFSYLQVWDGDEGDDEDDDEEGDDEGHEDDEGDANCRISASTRHNSPHSLPNPASAPFPLVPWHNQS